MIDIESMVFDTVYNRVSAQFPEADIGSGYDEKTAGHLVLVLRQTSNVPYKQSATDDCAENHARVVFEAEAVSDKEGTARSECKKLLGFVDGIMQGMKFRRIYMDDPVNIDRTRYRQYARYEVIVGKPVVYDAGTANERTVYQMYRR